MVGQTTIKIGFIISIVMRRQLKLCLVKHLPTVIQLYWNRSFKTELVKVYPLVFNYLTKRVFPSNWFWQNLAWFHVYLCFLNLLTSMVLQASSLRWLIIKGNPVFLMHNFFTAAFQNVLQESLPWSLGKTIHSHKITHSLHQSIFVQLLLAYLAVLIIRTRPAYGLTPNI